MAITGRQPDALRLTCLITLNLRLYALKQIKFVVDLENWQRIGANFREYRQHLLNLLLAFGLVGVDYVQQQVGIARLLQRSAKGLDQFMRQMTDKAHGIGQHDRTKVFQVQAPQRWVEGGEQLIRRIN